jgi:hypothetical protein
VTGDDGYFVRIDDSLVGRRAGGSAAEEARDLRSANPVGSLVRRALRVRSEERAWRKGAMGERLNGWLLDRLPDGWHVLHDIPIGHGGANIDHLVIGLSGVFTINTKNLSGRVWLAPKALLVNGHKTSYLPEAAGEARRASKYLSAALGRVVPVIGALAIIADDWTIKQRPGDVIVGSPRWVSHQIREMPVVLTAGDVVEIAAVAHKPPTWLA